MSLDRFDELATHHKYVKTLVFDETEKWRA